VISGIIFESDLRRGGIQKKIKAPLLRLGERKMRKLTYIKNERGEGLG
jgi:hypothetical protein